MVTLTGFSEFINQDILKNRLFSIVNTSTSKSLPLPHMIFSGPSGSGKSTLSHILAIERGVSSRTASSESRDIKDLLGNITNFKEFDVLIIEEIQKLQKRTLDILLDEVCKDYQITIIIGKGPSPRELILDLPRFSILGTSSEPSLIPHKLKNYMIQYDFEPYTINQIIQIVQFHANAKSITVTPDAASLLAAYSEKIPGKALGILDRVSHFSNVSKTKYLSFDVLEETINYLGIEKPINNKNEKIEDILNMDGTEFEQFIASIFRRRGYFVELTQASGDHGIDLIARKEDEYIAIQCKRWGNIVGEPIVRDFYGSLIHTGAKLGILFTSKSFSKQAYDFIKGKPILLIDLEGLLKIMSSNESIRKL